MDRPKAYIAWIAPRPKVGCLLTLKMSMPQEPASEAACLRMCRCTYLPRRSKARRYQFSDGGHPSPGVSGVRQLRMAPPHEEERYILAHPCNKRLSHSITAYRERARELERRSRQLPSPSRRRTSGTVAPGHQVLLPTPPGTGSSQRRQLAPTPGPAPRSESSTLGISARSIAQRARRERERQQRLLSVDGNAPPTPAPSNRRTRPGKHLTMAHSPG